MLTITCAGSKKKHVAHTHGGDSFRAADEDCDGFGFEDVLDEPAEFDLAEPKPPQHTDRVDKRAVVDSAIDVKPLGLPAGKLSATWMGDTCFPARALQAWRRAEDLY